MAQAAFTRQEHSIGMMRGFLFARLDAVYKRPVATHLVCDMSQSTSTAYPFIDEEYNTKTLPNDGLIWLPMARLEQWKDGLRKACSVGERSPRQTTLRYSFEYLSAARGDATYRIMQRVQEDHDPAWTGNPYYWLQGRLTEVTIWRMSTMNSALSYLS